MLLYTESVEVVSPLVEAARQSESVLANQPVVADLSAQSWAARWQDRWQNFWVKPRLQLGLSLGSDAITVVGTNKSISLPAMVGIRTAKRKVVAFAKEAEALQGREPQGVAVVRPIEAGTVTDRRLASQLLSFAVARCRGRWKGGPRVALAVPCDLSAVDSQNLVATVRSAGAREVHLLEQPVAALIGSGEDVNQALGRLVVHVGAGVVDVAVVCLGASVTSASSRTAGDALDEAIRDHLRREHKLLIDARQAKQIKHQIGSALPSVRDEGMTVSGRDLVEGRPAQRQITSLEIDRVLTPHLQALACQVKEVIAAMPIALLTDVRQEGACLTGGLARLNGLAEFLSRETRLCFRIPEEPESAVARGMQRLLREPRLRQAVLGKPRKSDPARSQPQVELRGSGLSGALVLTAGLALLTHSVPFFGQQAVGKLEHHLGIALTPQIPLLPLWPESPNATASSETAFQGRRLEQLEEENLKLRKLLKAPHFKPARAPVAADVVARDPRGWMSSMTINVGTSDGVEKGMAVTDGTNLVGLVEKAETNRAQVRLFTDPKAVTAARVPHTRGSGVVIGLGLEGLEMRYLDPDAGVKKGDWIVTSGLDRSYPAGLKLGWVTELSQPSGQNTLTAYLTPGMNIHQLRHVLVLRR